MKNTLKNFNLICNKIKILCDNTSAINLSKNPIHHSRTKHIDVRHHFLRDNVLKGKIKVDFIFTELQLADIFTKPLNYDRFNYIRRKLGICKLSDI